MHFALNSFQPPTGRNMLKKDAIPSIFCSEFENARNKNNIIENVTHEAKQTLSKEKGYETITKQVCVDTGTQVSPIKQRITEKNIQLQRKVYILQHIHIIVR